MDGLHRAGNGVISRNPVLGHCHSSALFPNLLELIDIGLICCIVWAAQCMPKISPFIYLAPLMVVLRGDIRG